MKEIRLFKFRITFFWKWYSSWSVWKSEAHHRVIDAGRLRVAFSGKPKPVDPHLAFRRMERMLPGINDHWRDDNYRS